MTPGKAAVTKSAIMDAGHEFLQTRPFRELTVGSLMKRIRLSRATFYLYFNDLHGLMEALLDEVKVGIVEGARPWLSNEGDPQEELRKSLASLIEMGWEHGAILKAVDDAAPNDERLENVWEAFVASFDEVVAARIANDQAAGITPEFDPLPVARALNRMDAGILIHAFGTPEKAPKAEVLAAVSRIWFSTLYPFDATAVIRTGAVSRGNTTKAN